jgi:hypothetical protein
MAGPSFRNIPRHQLELGRCQGARVPTPLSLQHQRPRGLPLRRQCKATPWLKAVIGWSPDLGAANPIGMLLPVRTALLRAV